MYREAGYITEKVMDALIAGVVPVYLGDTEGCKYICIYIYIYIYMSMTVSIYIDMNVYIIIYIYTFISVYMITSYVDK
jgi:hypothetical protein